MSEPLDLSQALQPLAGAREKAGVPRGFRPFSFFFQDFPLADLFRKS
jgi:hypothetical protein